MMEMEPTEFVASRPPEWQPTATLTARAKNSGNQLTTKNFNFKHLKSLTTYCSLDGPYIWGPIFFTLF